MAGQDGMPRDPGALTARLSLEQPVEEQDGQGGVSIAFAALGSVWCRVEPVSTVLEEEAGAEAAIATHRIWMGYREDIRRGLYFRKGLRLFRVLSVIDPDETKRFLKVTVEEEGR